MLSGWLPILLARDEKNKNPTDRVDRKPGISLELSKNSDDLHPPVIPLLSLTLPGLFRAIGQPR